MPALVHLALIWAQLNHAFVAKRPSQEDASTPTTRTAGSVVAYAESSCPAPNILALEPVIRAYVVPVKLMLQLAVIVGKFLKKCAVLSGASRKRVGFLSPLAPTEKIMVTSSTHGLALSFVERSVVDILTAAFTNANRTVMCSPPK